MSCDQRDTVEIYFLELYDETLAAMAIRARAGARVKEPDLTHLHT